ncbi:4-hydroxy-tetrahydrodipicolinate synthase [Actinoplanes couchii]|uniref:4-hydroxy-tetrahydrodipicolinate synthase n=2 Tax=Actinoplanes couchii TaxID=403638 RepID=A0ABQ3XN28_9ACTN|nr:4-hydroxy-tetrahydrodipicolinate synthase [Actinoplanes couchii]
MVMTLNGILVPLITPFDTDGTVALGALERLAHRVLDEGAAGLVALGTTGEPGSLTAAEQEAVVEVTAAVSRERGTTLLVGARPDLVARPEVTAALVTVPAFVRPGEAGVIAHFETVAATMPVVIYHVPYRTGQQLSAQTLLRLAAIPGVIGMKYSAGAIDETTAALVAGMPDGFALLGGDDAVLSPLLAIGAHGGIAASANVDARSFVDLHTAWRDGDIERARTLGNRLTALSRSLFAEPNPTVIKGTLHDQEHIPTTSVRLPLLPAAPASIRHALDRLTLSGSARGTR